VRYSVIPRYYPGDRTIGAAAGRLPPRISTASGKVRAPSRSISWARWNLDCPRADPEIPGNSLAGAAGYSPLQHLASARRHSAHACLRQLGGTDLVRLGAMPAR
jgi:hypothetical protein